MTISLDSRYANGHYTRSLPNPRKSRLGHPADSPPVVLRAGKPRSTGASVGYIWTVGDRWDNIADMFGIPKTDWWMLMDANPQIEFPFAMQPGMVINIPDTVRRRNK